MRYHIETLGKHLPKRYWIGSLALAIIFALALACTPPAATQDDAARAQAAEAQAAAAAAQAEAAQARAAAEAAQARAVEAATVGASNAEALQAQAQAAVAAAQAAAIQARAAAEAAQAVAEAARRGEDRPSITVIGNGSASGTGGGTGTGSVSGIGVGTGIAAMGTSDGGEYYTPVSDVTPHANLALDLRDIAALLNAARTGDTVDYDAIADIYENGRHAGGRTFRGYATSDSVLAEFPGDIDLDGNVQAALSGNWAGRQVDDLVRRQLLDKSLQAIIYGKVLQEMSSARSQMEQGNLDDANGAPHKVDEGWAFYVGAPNDEGQRIYSIANTARNRAANFDLHGTLDPMIQGALADALAASRSGDMEAFDAAAARVRGGLNTIFHLASVRYTRLATRDTGESARAQHLAEAWAFYQPISPTVRSASPGADRMTNALFTRDPANPVPPAEANAALAALNAPEVRSALGLPQRVDFYLPVSDVEVHASLALDLRDIAGLLNAARNGETVDYDTITDIYENGRHAGGRTLQDYATDDSVLAEFPGDFDLDAVAQAGLTGNWAGRQVDDLVRRQLINKALQAVIYGKVNQELSAARSQMEQGNLDDANGAPHKVDEAWAFYNGTAAPNGSRIYSIASTARSREGNFKVAPNVSVPLAQALSDALEASRTGDLEAYDDAAARARAGLNSIFYLATLRYGYLASQDDSESARAQHLAEGWAFFQPIAPTVAAADRSAHDAISDVFTRDPSREVSSSDVDAVYDGLNGAAVIEALGIPANVRVTSPDVLQ